jgi:hypothetical protein
MKNKLENILKIWDGKHNEDECVYSKQQITEIAVNCISITETWLNRVKNPEKASLEFVLYNKEDVVCEILNGINSDNIAITLLEMLAYKKDMYSKLVVNWFTFKNGEKNTNCIGELKID